MQGKKAQFRMCIWFTLVKTSGILKHACHVCDLRNIPVSHSHIKYMGSIKHRPHSNNLGHCPLGYILSVAKVEKIKKLKKLLQRKKAQLEFIDLPWLNFAASRNMLVMFVTCATFHSLIGLSKLTAPLNMDAVEATLNTVHLDISVESG